MYRCEATTLTGFVQQLATSYLRHGYFFYVQGLVPEGKDPARIDEKLVDRYGVAISKWERARRKRGGIASVQYLRFERQFVLVATHGEHRFFTEERARLRDVRHVALRIGGYAVSVRHGHVRVSIELEEYRRLKAYFLEVATHHRSDVLASELGALPFEPYAPVRRQLLCILRAVNRARAEAGFEPVTKWCFRFKRRIVRPFAPTSSAEEESAA